MTALHDIEKKENIVLDVRLTEMINTKAFRAVLENGHELVAYLPRHGRKSAALCLNVGDRAQVCMSPFDMSRGAISFPQEQDHEG